MGFFVLFISQEFLMGLLFEQMAWNYAEPNNSDNKNCLPCIFFQFTDKVEDGRKLKKVMQVFTREVSYLIILKSCLFFYME